MDESIERQCLSKLRYYSRAEAKKAVKAMNQRDGKPKGTHNVLSAYPCPWAPDGATHFHVGHRPTRVSKIDE